MAYEDYHVNADDVKLDGDPNIRRTVPPSPSGGGGGIAYGTCTTAANVAVKAVTLSDASSWELKQGASVAVKFSYTNSYEADVNDPVQLNVNNSGAKNIYYGDSANPTGTNPTAFGRANCINTYIYDGTYWVWAGSCIDGNSTNYVGTKAAWDLLPSTVKAQYLTMDFIDDGAGFEDISDSEISYTSSDVADGSATAWTSVTPITTGLSLRTLFGRVSQMFKNIRYLYKMLGTTDISAIGNGTVTGGLNTLNNQIIKSSDSFGVIGGYSGTAGSESKYGSFTFSKGTYKKFIIVLHLGSYTIGIVDTLIEDELIAICNTGNAYVKSTVGAWNTAYSIINISLSGDTFTCVYNARNTAGNVIARLYGCTV